VGRERAFAGGVICSDGAKEDVVVGIVPPYEVRWRVVAQVHFPPTRTARPVRARARVIRTGLRAHARGVRTRLARRHTAL
jgi:hypothetical protein